MRYAARLLLSNRGFTAVAVVSLALGIGGNTLMFSIVNAVLIRPLPYGDSERLVFVWFTPPGRSDQKRPATADDFRALREQSRLLEHIGIVGGIGEVANLTNGPDEYAEQLQGQRFSASIPQALAAKPLLGRWFTEAESEPGADPVVVISYALWQSHLGHAPDIVGKTIRLDGETATVIGVMPERWMLFNYPADYWAPERTNRDVKAGLHRTHLLAARIKGGIDQLHAQEEMNRIAARLSEAYPSTNKGWGIQLEPALDVYVSWVRKPLLILEGIAALVLVIACANVAGLLLATASARKKEIALRAALGAGRCRIVRQLLIESAVLSVLGGLAGIGVAWVGLRLFIITSPSWFPRLGEIGLDSGTLCFSVVLSLGTAMIFGLIPSLQASRADLVPSLKAPAGSARGPAAQIMRSGLMVCQVSIALVLLIGAGLMANTFARLVRSPLGCDCRDAITFQVRIPSRNFVQDTADKHGKLMADIKPTASTVFEQIRQSIAAIPGVESAAVGMQPPFSEADRSALAVSFAIEGRQPNDAEGQTLTAAWMPVSESYFRTLRVPILRGREFETRDTASTSPVAVINQALAGRYWPGQNPIGKQVQVKLVNEPPREIVGVVGDLRQETHEPQPVPQMYVPYAQQSLISTRQLIKSRLTMTYIVRATGDRSALVPALRAAVAKVDRSVPVSNLKTVKDSVTEQLWQPQQTMVFLVVFSSIATILAMTGIYGIVAYIVQQRTQEIGIRVALGASSLSVLRLVIARGLMLIALGVVIGLAAALSLTRILGTFLWGVTPMDAFTYAVAIAVLVAAGLLACYVSARRALAIEPLVALRCD